MCLRAEIGALPFFSACSFAIGVFHLSTFASSLALPVLPMPPPGLLPLWVHGLPLLSTENFGFFLLFDIGFLVI